MWPERSRRLKQSISKTRLSQRVGASPVRLMSAAPASAGANGGASTFLQVAWLVAWLVNNIGITMLNKFVFSKAEPKFEYPLVTSAFHMLCNWLGTVLYFAYSETERQPINRQHWRTLCVFSVVFSLNIGVGNISSQMVPVSFNQVMRSLVPAIVMAIGIYMFNKQFSEARKLAVAPVVLGVAMACYGDTAESLVGLVVTLLCVLLAALKVVLSGEMLTGEIKMPPLHLLSRMAPLALVQLFGAAIAVGEVTSLWENWEAIKQGTVLYVVLIAGIFSFSLNLCSLMANKITSPLTLSIMANVKQVLIIAFSAVVFEDPISTLNIIGFVVVVLASTRYSLISVGERKRDALKPLETGTGGPLLPK